MSFVDVDDVIAVNEGFLKRVFAETLGVEIELPITRIKYREAMERFGSDKPDLRFDLELVDIGDIARGCGFRVFSEPMAAGGSVRLINVPGGAAVIPRKQIDSLTDFVKTYGAKGLAWTRLTPDGASSSYSKFLTDDENAAILERAGARTGDLVLIVADASESVTFAALGALRCECAGRLGLIKPGDYKLLWVTEFPLFEYSEEEGRYVAMHHPFTAPLDGDEDKLLGDKGACRAKAYDIILNGTELGGGSIRISAPQLQERMFEALGFTEDDARERFGHLITAFRYGAPPHGGLAYGLDRLVMLLCGAESIRDVIAFPKVQNASELMTGAPGEVGQKQLDELAIKTK
jgi:aspartyl-tRNA synthetase